MIYFETNFVGNTFRLDHPRVLWNSATRRGTVTASSSADGYAAVNAATATTWDRWKPTELPAWWSLSFTEETISALAIDTHTLGTSGASVAVQEWNGSGWVDLIAAVSPSDDAPIAFLFRERAADRIRLYITGAAVPSIAVVHVSEALELPQRVYMGAPTPIDLALRTEFETTQSANGQWMGRSVSRFKNENDFTVQHLTERYVREVFFPFIKDAREYPYFLLERPYSFPAALSYRWRDDDIRPERMGIKSYMQVSL